MKTKTLETTNRTAASHSLSNKSYNNVLIIDDAIGSGGTVNEIARKLKQRSKVKHCHAYAVVGSYKGFDVISAV